jgi:hypothetical protein
MENGPINNIESLFERAGDYAETRIDLWKLKATQKSADIVSSLASRIIWIMLILIFVMVLNIGIALYVGELLGKNYYGFFALAGLYLIAGLIFKAFGKKWIKVPVANSIIKKIYT